MNARLIQLAIFILLLLVGARAVLKTYGNHKDKAAAVREFKQLTTEASFYRQFDQAGAEGVLLKCLATIEDARALGLSLEEIYERAYAKDDDVGRRTSSSQEKLVRYTVDNAYRAAQDLNMLERTHLESLRQGRMPALGGGKPVIAPLIDPEIAPGMEKIVPNLEIHPPGTKLGSRALGAVEIAAARRLAKSLASAKLIERSMEDMILEHYETKTEEELEPAK